MSPTTMNGVSIIGIDARLRSMQQPSYVGSSAVVESLIKGLHSCTMPTPIELRDCCHSQQTASSRQESSQSSAD